MRRLTEWTGQRSWIEMSILGLLLISVLAWLQHFTPDRMSYTAPFLFATGVVGWLGGFKPACIAAATGTLLIFSEEWKSALGDPKAWVVWFNAATRLGSFLCVGWLAAGWRRSIQLLEDRVLARTAELRQEVEERRRIEEQLRESGLRFQQLAENIGEVFWMTNPEKSEMVYVSPAYERVWGRTCRSLYESPTTWLLAIDAEDRGFVAQAAQTKQTDGRYDEEYRIHRPDGAVRWVRDRAFPVRDEKGEIYRVAGIATDITDRKLAELALRNEQERLRAIITGAPLILFAIDADGTITFEEGAGLQTLGFTPGRNVGQRFEEVFAATPAVVAAIRRALQGEAFDAVQQFGLHWFHTHYNPQRDAHGRVTGVIGVALDVTEREQAERRLAIHQAVAQVLAESPALPDAAVAILRQLCERMAWDCGVFWRVGRKSRLLRCVALWSKDPAATSDFRTQCCSPGIEPDEGLAGRAWSEEHIVSGDPDTAEPRPARRAFLQSQGLRAGIAFPVRSGGTVIGVVELFSAETREPDAQGLELFETIGTQLGQFATRKEAEETIKTQALIVEHMDEGMVVCDDEGFIVMTNPAAEQLSGYTHAELLGRHVTLLSPWSEDETTRTFGNILEQLQRVGQWFGVLPHRRKDGSVFLGEVVLNRIQLGDRALLVALQKDVTEKKRAEERLRTQARVLESMSEGVVLCDPQGRIALTNPALDYMFGYAHGELLGQPVEMLRNTAPGAAGSTPATSLAEMAKSGQWAGHFAARAKDGREFLCETRVSNMETDGAQFMVMVFQDITEKHRTAQALQESTERFQQLADNVSAVFWLSSADNLTSLYVSPGYEKIWGRSCQSLHDRPGSWIESVHPEDQPRVRAQRPKQAEGNYDVEYRIVRPDGELRWVRDRGFPVRDEQGNVVRLAGIAMDVTERKRAEAALAGKERLYRTLFDLSPSGILVEDAGGTILDVNVSLCRESGYSRDELLGRNVKLFVPPEEFPKVGEHLARLRAGQPLAHRVQNVRKDGSRLVVELLEQPIVLPDGRPGFLVVAHDITARSLSEQVLETQARVLQRMAEGVMLVGPDYRIQLTNPALDTMLGFAPGELVGRAVTDLSAVSPEQTAREIEEITASVRTTGHWQGEFGNWRGRAGQLVTRAHISGLLVNDEPHFVIVLQDVTAQRRSEEALKLQALVLQNMAEGVLLVAPDRTIRLANPALETTFGYAPGELVGKDVGILNAWTAEETARFNDDVAAKAQRRGAWTGEYTNRRKDGTVFTSESRISTLVLNGQTHFLSVQEDITERKQAEETVKTQALVLENMAEAAITCDENGVIQYINAAVVSSCGYARNELLGRHITCLSPLPQAQSSAFFQTMISALQSEGIWRGEVPLRRKNEMAFHGECIIRRLMIGGRILDVGVFQDVTERKRAEAAVRESEERYRSLVHNLNVGVYRNTPGAQGRFIQANPALARMHGYDSIEEFQQVKVADLYQNPADREAFLAEVLNRGSVRDHELKLKRKDGTAIEAAVTATAHRDPEGNVVWMDGVLEDITERKRAESQIRQLNETLEQRVRERTAQLQQANAALQRSEATARSLLNIPTAAAFLIDREGICLDANETLASRFGLAVADVVGKSIWDLFSPEVGAKRKAHFQGVLLEKKLARYEDERQGIFNDSIIAPILDERGEVARVAVLGFDITERKRIEKALRISEARYRRLHESMTDAFVSTDMQGRIRESNPAYRALLGYTEQELARLTFADLTPEQWHAMETRIVNEEILVLGHSDVYEKEYRRKDGTVFPVELRTFLIRDDAGQPDAMWAIVRDITERKQAEAAIRQLNETLEHRVRERTSQLEQANHELRESEERFRILFESAPMGIALHGADGRYMEVNHAYQQMVGYTNAELLPLGPKVVTHPEDIVEGQRYYRELCEGQRSRYSREKRYLRKDGRLVWAHAAASAVRSLDGKLRYIISMVEDVTAQKRAAHCSAAFSRLGLQLSAATTPVEAANIILGTASDLFGWDAGYLHLCAAGTGEILCVLTIDTIDGRKVTIPESTFTSEPSPLMLEVMRSGGRLINRDVPAADADASLQFIPFGDTSRRSASIMCVPIRHGTNVIGILSIHSYQPLAYAQEDLATLQALADHCGGALERIHAAGRLKWLEREVLEVADREQARIGQDIHDGLCQQLVSLAFDANSLEHQLAAQARPEAVTAQRICAQLDGAITESRQLSRGLFPVRLEAEGLVSALEELATATQSRFGVHCRLHAPKPVLVADNTVATNLFRIAQEAVTNAVKHGKPKKISIHLRDTEAGIELAVKDDGLGISTKPPKDHAGMGLPIMEYRARTLGGTLRFDRGPQGGTVVSCCVPRRRA